MSASGYAMVYPDSVPGGMRSVTRRLGDTLVAEVTEIDGMVVHAAW